MYTDADLSKRTKAWRINPQKLEYEHKNDKFRYKLSFDRMVYSKTNDNGKRINLKKLLKKSPFNLVLKDKLDKEDVELYESNMNKLKSGKLEPGLHWVNYYKNHLFKPEAQMFISKEVAKLTNDIYSESLLQNRLGKCGSWKLLCFVIVFVSD